MDYRERLKDENASVRERYELARERIVEIAETSGIEGELGVYFETVAGFLNEIFAIIERKGENRSEDRFDTMSLEEAQALNARLFADILPENYDASFANPDVAVDRLKETFGPQLCMIYGEIRGLIAAAFEYRLVNITIFSELFIELYNLFEEAEPEKSSVTEAIYWFYHDYSELFIEQQIQEQVDPTFSFATDIVKKSTQGGLRYLYDYGEYIGQVERESAEDLQMLSAEEIDAMAATFVEGYRKGFELAGIDLTKKRTVNIRYNIGFERVIAAAIEKFKELDLEPVIYRATPSKFLRSGMARVGYTGVSANRQYDFDHKDDCALYLDKAITERKLEELKASFEENKRLAAQHAGPAVMEIFGEPEFEPVAKKTAPSFDAKQQELRVYYANEAGMITNRYIPGDERSFTIIAFPVRTIGQQYEEIFRETIRINTLDYAKYARIQQHLIDALDQGDYVEVHGTNGNYTDLRVNLKTLDDPAHETRFENCVADVNIPVGEVFTSPKLTGTNGVLYVSQVYLNGLEYRDLYFTVEDGMVKDYGCSNFKTPEENRKYIKDNVLYQHETLPIGEFAIGTNTAAYRMAKKYDIAAKLPILIAEKTGPHFAFGDTCYSFQEDMETFNPDGKKIVARENEVSALRTSDPSKAYFNCHTDVTIPFEELGSIRVMNVDGSVSATLIENGRFVLPGTEELNEYLTV